MSYIFLDESGDLGFDFSKKNTSKVFVITCLFVKDKKSIEKIVKKIHSGITRNFKRKISMLHSVKEKPITRKRLLKQLIKTDCLIMTIYLNKKKVYTKLKDEKAVLYNYVTNILLDRIYSKKIIPIPDDIELVASKRETNKYLNDNFKDYLNKQVKSRHGFRIKIVIKTPFEEKILQAVDFVSWSIYRKYEYNDDSYYKIIKKKIIEENPLFP